jgi:type II pantothenate kinase
MKLAKFDELDSLIRGMLYVEMNNAMECYYWTNPTEPDKCQKETYDFSDPYPFIVSNRLPFSFFFNYLNLHYNKQ